MLHQATIKPTFTYNAAVQSREMIAIGFSGVVHSVFPLYVWHSHFGKILLRYISGLVKGEASYIQVPWIWIRLCRLSIEGQKYGIPQILPYYITLASQIILQKHPLINSSHPSQKQQHFARCCTSLKKNYSNKITESNYLNHFWIFFFLTSVK